MCAIGHFLEEEGIATVSISLVRPHVEVMKPPRSLWVPFELGRPLGVPCDASFQHGVLMAALDLLTSDGGPVLLVDYPKDVPEVKIDMDGWVCPIPLESPSTIIENFESFIVGEMVSLQPWYDLAKKTRGRTTFGVSGENITELGRFVSSYLGEEPRPSYRSDLAVGDAMKLACDDIKAFYFEVAAAQPGSRSRLILENWFWGETIAGKILLNLKVVCLDSDDLIMKALGNFTLVPRSQLHRLQSKSN